MDVEFFTNKLIANNDNFRAPEPKALARDLGPLEYSGKRLCFPSAERKLAIFLCCSIRAEPFEVQPFCSTLGQLSFR